MRISDWSSDVCSSDLVLWSVAPSELGISAPQAVSELLQAGAVIARRDSDGSVYFRALGNDAQRIAHLVSSKYSREATQEGRFASDQPSTSFSAKSSARRVGTECVSTCRSQGPPTSSTK